MVRAAAACLIVLGLGTCAYALVTTIWSDPLTAAYMHWKQRGLEESFQRSLRHDAPAVHHAPAFPAARPPTSAARTWETAVSTAALRERRSLRLGQPLGRIAIRRIGLSVVFVDGTRWLQDLSRGPGRYPQASLPGLGGTTAIAGHRTTFGAPFRHVDELRRGDPIVVTMTYGTFVYRVVGHQVVSPDDWHVIRPRGFDALVLTTCDPPFSASHRLVIVARLARVRLPDGTVESVRVSRPAPVRRSAADGPRRAPRRETRGRATSGTA